MANLNTSGSIWVDVNSGVTRNGLPDRLPDQLSITHSSFYNLLGCPIGGRSRTFQPTYGTLLYQLLHEPLDQQTGDAIQIGLIQALAKWEPRISLDYSETWVRPDYTLPGFRIRLTYTVNLTGQTEASEFAIRR